MVRKYENGFTIINNSDKYNIYKIRIYKKAMKRKSDTCTVYLCDVWYKDRKDGWPMLLKIDEPYLDEILENNK